jgi:hypothetical protein
MGYEEQNCKSAIKKMYYYGNSIEGIQLEKQDNKIAEM